MKHTRILYIQNVCLFAVLNRFFFVSVKKCCILIFLILYVTGILRTEILMVVRTVAPFAQPVQGGNAALLFRLSVLYKMYEHGLGGIVVLPLNQQQR